MTTTMRKRETQGTRVRKKGLDEMPVKRRKIVIRGEGATILCCIQKRSLPFLNGCGRVVEVGAACTLLPVSYIIRPPFFLSPRLEARGDDHFNPSFPSFFLPSSRSDSFSTPFATESAVPATMGLIRHWE